MPPRCARAWIGMNVETKKACGVVRIPTVHEGGERAITRERQRLAAMGRSHLATHTIQVTGKWWKGADCGRMPAARRAGRAATTTRVSLPTDCVAEAVGAEPSRAKGVRRRSTLPDRANPTDAYDIYATLLHAPGIDHTWLTCRTNGTDRGFTDVHESALHNNMT
jgi:hypothetical protein